MSHQIERLSHKNLSAIVEIQREALSDGVISQLPYRTRLRYLTWLTCHPKVTTWVAIDDNKNIRGLLVVSPTDLSRPVCLNLELACTATAVALRNPRFWPVLWHELRQGETKDMCCQRSISLFAVMHTARSNGLGSRLLDTAIRNEIASGTTTLCTSTHNLRLVEHYRRRYSAEIVEVNRLKAYDLYDLAIRLPQQS